MDELGARVVAIGVSPDGLNINQGVGSTHLRAVREAVREHGADLGIALDGDGDRVLMVDDTGAEVDGDELLYVIARARHRGGMLRGSVVGTLMTNLGLEQALQAQGIGLVRTKVGDRYILERLRQEGWTLGGEPSGHIICLDRTTTGDGTVSALQVLAEMMRTGRSLRELREGLVKFPQRLINVRLAGAAQTPPCGRRWSRTPCAGSRPSSAAAAGCCCDRRAPSRCYGDGRRRGGRPGRAPGRPDRRRVAGRGRLAAAGHWIGITTISTRRLRARPSAVELSAIGRVLP